MPNEKNREGKAEKELKNTDYEALTALLDFHSDRATAHASFLVACIFGLFTVLTLMRGLGIIPKFLYFFVYLGLWGGGLYSLYNFGEYAKRASSITLFISDHKKELIQQVQKEAKDRRKRDGTEPNRVSERINKLFYRFKRWEYRLILMFVLYFVFIGLLPLLIVFLFI